MLDVDSALETVYSPFEVACLDVQGTAGRRPGERPARRARSGTASTSAATCSTSGPRTPARSRTSGARRWTPTASSAQARRMVDGWGFASLKLKGGVFAPEVEMRGGRGAARGLPRPPAAPGPQRRLDPGDLGAGGRAAGRRRWSTSRTPPPASRAWPRSPARPTDAAGHQHVRDRTGSTSRPRSPPAPSRSCCPTTTCWGGLRRSALLAGICETFGLGLSMHSNSHLGISLAAMVHLAASSENLTYACDTHYPWKTRGPAGPRGAGAPRRRRRRAHRPGPGRRARPRRGSPSCTSSG